MRRAGSVKVADLRVADPYFMNPSIGELSPTESYDLRRVSSLVFSGVSFMPRTDSAIVRISWAVLF